MVFGGEKGVDGYELRLVFGFRHVLPGLKALAVYAY